jgi:prepilin-type processing-associated H-X9-DG protein
VWDANAAFWDGHIGPEGNQFHRVLVAPAQMRLLSLQPGERVIELACGNGQFSREMARAGASVTACDFSTVFVERARGHASDGGLTIAYHVADVTDEAQILALGEEGAFDADRDNDSLPDAEDTEPLGATGICAAFSGSSDGNANPAGGDVTNDDNGDGNPAPPMGSDAADRGPSWDTDGDGVRDGVECVLGTNPRSSAYDPGTSRRGR